MAHCYLNFYHFFGAGPACMGNTCIGMYLYRIDALMAPKTANVCQNRWCQWLNLWLQVSPSVSLSQFVHQILCLPLPPTTTTLCGSLGEKSKYAIYILFIGIYRLYVYISMFHIISLSISKYIIHQHKVEFHRPADVYHSLCQPHMPQPQRDVFPKFVSRISTYISHSQFWICRGFESSVCCELFFLGGQKHRFPVSIFFLGSEDEGCLISRPSMLGGWHNSPKNCTRH